ncbi:MAG: DMT family transporter [Alphaproteobacteria bacterium]|jgi:drug/metabolite transporter (DMT)-like permease|nr:DMT family transporter [Alphaproteobacteria bacterium]
MSHLKTLILACSPATIWGILFVMATPIFQEISPIYFATIRYLPSAMVVFIVLYVVEGRAAFKLDKMSFYAFLLGAFSMTGFNVLVWMGVNLSSGVMGAVINPIMPLFAIIVSFILFRQKFNTLTFVIILIAFVGVFIAASEGNLAFLTEGNPLGVLLIIIGCIMATFSGVLAPKFKDYSVLRFTAITSIGGITFFILFAYVETMLGYANFPTWQNIVNIKWELLYTVVLAGTFPMLLWFRALKIIGAVNVMLLNNLIPVVAIIGSILMGYGVTNFEIIGATFVISAMALHYFNVKRTTHAI